MVRTVSAAETAPATWPWLIHAEQLVVRAGRQVAVNGLDLTLDTGVHGLLGPNGAGKTTLMRALATVVNPASGRLRLLGQSVTDPAGLRQVRRELGYLPQHFGFYPRFTVREFVEYVAWLKEMPKSAIPGAVQRAVERVGLADRADTRMKTLSGGMLRRAGIAQAIVNEPRLLLLDEPTVGLDPEQRLDFRHLLRDVGVDSCVLVSTHLVEDVAAACTDVVLIDAGRLVWQGTPAQLAQRGTAGDAGDSATERGYSALLRAHRGQVPA
ncbi:ABC-type multidrug transport system, ATPase component [Micromonospora phaseoli]|uniref:ABC-type multidrug transport system, ATPase component n=1 Tax=Micromonospora phaseoli TaxID=1144548 RepID=A0A1H7A1B5_9ACTN|nr:ABC transporter ATP-binding protein [Micromonospora phaseoli]PZV96900.1 ABC-type multidrug transport system ATPase subunit [Micromonospora phaseoli]GIJ77876.1 ABC transporter ATP-binding protein [Micromonospora phaseoli]SEJ59391.1 ABC-type multidrug transport system, ATPase component [Micromonospora phaseoli]